MSQCFWSGYATNNSYPFCEQQLCSMIVEPANTWSNIGYLIVAFFIFTNKHVKSRRVKNFFALSTLCLFVGSTAMHASGTYWGKIADVSAMFFLSNVILTLALERYFKLSEFVANFIFAVMFALSVTFLVVTGFGGKLFLLQLLVASILEYRMKALRVENILKSCGIFLAAFTFWLLDVKKILCWPDNHILTGHALWHLLGATAIWVYFLAYNEKGKS
jgi:hypothetical protein